MESAGKKVAVSRNFQSGPIWPRNWSDMASKLVRYGLETGPIWISVLSYRTTFEAISDHFENSGKGPQSSRQIP